MRTILALALLATLAGCALETGPPDPRLVRMPGTPGATCYTGCER